MANLKLDLQNKIRNTHYYDEMEFSRLAQDPMMNYESKICKMSLILDRLTLTQSKLALIEVFFPEITPENTPIQQGNVIEQRSQPIVSQPLPGQTHGE